MESNWIDGLDAWLAVVRISLHDVYDMLPICPAAPLPLGPQKDFPFPVTGRLLFLPLPLVGWSEARLVL